MAKKKKIPDKYQIWIDAKKRFHLSNTHIQMARELGLNPKKFGKLANNKQEPWKMPLPQFIEHIYFKRFGKEKPDVVRSIGELVENQNKKKQERRERRQQQKQADYIAEVGNIILAQIESLIGSILKIPGRKIVTLVTDESGPPFIIDVSEEGVFGHEEGHESMFKTKLCTAFGSAGGLIIRQFLPFKVERKMPDGNMAWIPKKNIYGVEIALGKWRPLPKSEVQSAHCTDYKTGKPIPQEEDVSFCDFPV